MYRSVLFYPVRFSSVQLCAVWINNDDDDDNNNPSQVAQLCVCILMWLDLFYSYDKTHGDNIGHFAW